MAEGDVGSGVAGCREFDSLSLTWPSPPASWVFEVDALVGPDESSLPD